MAQEMQPISKYKQGFTQEESEKFKNEANLGEWLAGGDASAWVNLRPAEAFPSTAVLPNRLPAKPFPKAIIPEIGKIEAPTDEFGTISLDEFMAHPQNRTQGYLVVHKGEIVYESYPGMNPTDNHIWMSCAKTLPGLVVELLIDEGKINENDPIGNYVEAFKGTAWENIKVIDVMDMTTGLNIQEQIDGVSYGPGTIANRMLAAEFGMPSDGKMETMVGVLQDAKKDYEPGTQFDYASVATQALVLLAESVIDVRWSEYVDQHIWSKMYVEAPLLIHTTPDGFAIGHGMISSRLTDFARYGMLYTPSWDKVSNEQIVTKEILERIQKGTRSNEFYRKGYGPNIMDHTGDETMISNARQWDAVWADGDLYKAGFQNQCLYVSPSRDLVVVIYSTSNDRSSTRYARRIATSGLFD